VPDLAGRLPMTDSQLFLKGKRILVVDDEEDILVTIGEILEAARLDIARDYESASLKISEHHYDLAILDIMGVDGLKLLEEAVERGIPAVMLTAHALSPQNLMTSIDKGAIAYLPKEKLKDLDDLIAKILGSHEKGEPTWKLLFELLEKDFEHLFGPDWKKKDQEFWSELSRGYHVGKGIKERLLHDEKVLSKGI
jgi:DNA-binding NtrC family response regulator